MRKDLGEEIPRYHTYELKSHSGHSRAVMFPNDYQSQPLSDCASEASRKKKKKNNCPAKPNQPTQL